jgi:hypothetical protein
MTHKLIKTNKFNFYDLKLKQSNKILIFMHSKQRPLLSKGNRRRKKMRKIKLLNSYNSN